MTRSMHSCMLAGLLAVSAQWVAADEKRPNILLILADDMGYSDPGCYGSEIDTPNLDALAADGLRFTNFYNAARCCPTRAALLTGVYPHEAGMGGMVSPSPAKSPGPYQGYLNARPTIAEVLKPAGYRSYLAGKWHVGEFRPQWPVDRGFDHSYGLISGGMNYYDIRKGKAKGVSRVFARDGERIVPEAGEFYATDAFTDAALGYLGNHKPGGDPFFLYLAYTAPHWPLHAPEELVRKYEARYLRDWAGIREARHRKQGELGLAEGDGRLSPPDSLEWDKLKPGQRKTMARKMAVYAAMVERMDWNIGRVIGRLREARQLDNTLVLFLSDNGACAEGGQLGHDFRPDLQGEIGTVDSYHSYGQSWSNLSNTPLRRHKSHTHEGGIRSPAIAHWPAGIKAAPGSIDKRTVAHVIDLLPTFAELAGAENPEGLRGISLLQVLGGAEPESRILGWEHFGAAAWRSGKWKLVRKNSKAAWELYDISKDPAELADLSAENPERSATMAAAWDAWAKEIGVR